MIMEKKIEFVTRISISEGRVDEKNIIEYDGRRIGTYLEDCNKVVAMIYPNKMFIGSTLLAIHKQLVKYLENNEVTATSYYCEFFEIV